MPNMKYILTASLIAVMFSCSDHSFERPELSKRPIVTVDLTADTVKIVGNGKADTTLIVGAEKELEAGSAVVFRLDITSDTPMKLFSVSSSSLNRAPESRVVRTIPDGALDGAGNFIQPLTNVTIFYKYLISLNDVPGVPVILTFSIYNDRMAEAIRTNKFSPLRKGSTNGEKLIVSRQFLLRDQGYTDRVYLNRDAKKDDGNMLSLDENIIYPISYEIPDFSKIDVICINSGGILLASPSDPILRSTPALLGKYSFLYDATNKLKTKSLTKFKVLANYDKAKFDQTTHGELFDTDLSNMTQTLTPVVKNGDVVGFQRYDGSRGIIYVETINYYWFKYEKRRLN